MGPKETQGDPKEPKGTQGEGTQGGPRGPKGALGALEGDGAHGTLGGYFGATPNGRPFRLAVGDPTFGFWFNQPPRALSAL